MIVHDQKMTPIDFGVKGQGHIDLVGKNGFIWFYWQHFSDIMTDSSMFSYIIGRTLVTL
jgi:hypothetical protein